MEMWIALSLNLNEWFEFRGYGVSFHLLLVWLSHVLFKRLVKA